MATISLSLPSDGSTIDASDVNTPFNTIAAAINGNLDLTNLSTGSAWSWPSWTPTWVNITLGNGTVVAKYIQIGKTVLFNVSLTFGTTTSIAGDIRFTIPVTSVNYVTAYSRILGNVSIFDASVGLVGGIFYGTAQWFDTSNIQPVLQRSDTNNLSSGTFSASNPMVWTTGDVLNVHGFYEAA